MGVWSNILDILFPPKCTFCGKVIIRHTQCLCDKCSSNLPYTKGAQCSQKGDFFDTCVSPLFYEDDVRKSILRFKFKSIISYTECYGRQMADCVRDNLAGQYDLITWVPLSIKRAKTRGYDQAMLLAMAVALELDNVAVDTLVKNLHVQPQSSIEDSEKRRANVSGVYDIKDAELIAERKILLVDDIITTGATLSECARTLLLGGAESVVCATLARG